MSARRGFTLLEVMVAAGLLVVAILATLAATTSGGLLRNSSRQSLLVGQLLSERAEHLRGVEREQLLTTLAQPVTEVAGFQVTGTQGDFTLRRGPLARARVQVSVLSEQAASQLFQVDRDGDGAPELLDLDRDGTPGEGAGESDLGRYEVTPVTITVTYRDATSGVQRTRSVPTIFY